MSHAIHLVAPAGAIVDDDAIVAGVVGSGNWLAPGDGSLTYRNASTGARATLESLDVGGLPDSFRPLGVALVVPYVRPRWFALETIPLIAAATAGSEVLAFDPQADSPAPEPVDVDRLVTSWDRGNRAAIRAARAGGGTVLWLDPGRSEAWWRHQQAISGLTLRFGLDHYVPSLRILRHADGDRVVRAMSWPDSVPALLPECDRYVLLDSTGPGQFAIRGVADSATVRERLGDLVESVSLSWPDVDRIDRLAPGRSEEAVARLASVALEPLSAYSGVGPEDIVDVPPG